MRPSACLSGAAFRTSTPWTAHARSPTGLTLDFGYVLPRNRDGKPMDSIPPRRLDG